MEHRQPIFSVFKDRKDGKETVDQARPNQSETNRSQIDEILEDIERAKFARDFFRLLRTIAEIDQFNTRLKAAVNFLTKNHLDDYLGESMGEIKQILLELKDICTQNAGSLEDTNNSSDWEPARGHLFKDRKRQEAHQLFVEKLLRLEAIINSVAKIKAKVEKESN